jgi:hypothetical protein
MATKRSTTKTTRAKRARARGGTPTVAALERQVRRLQKALEAERERHEKQLDGVRRAANRRLAVMMQEIATLRHHEARAGALERLLASRGESSAEGSEHGEDPRIPG